MENQNQNPKAQLIDRLKQANNVLVTVSKNPSVDQLSAAIGLTLMLNHIDKHATAVFSGVVPDTLEFLKPEETLERNTDSLRDFIISLDKAKADKLRYKVEDKMVKIFITPYKTSLSDADLVFGQGDFNVDVVVAIGVQEKEDLDEAITSHGRILHDATVATVNTVVSGQLGSINWIDAKASSLSEMLVSVSEGLKPSALDSQMATAFLTGIVAETARFSNEKTSSDTMNISAKLMAAGANQQLVATQLEQKQSVQESNEPEVKSEIDQAEDAVKDALSNDGSLDISHTDEPEIKEEQKAEEPSQDLPEIHQEHSENEASSPDNDNEQEEPSRLILEPPTLGSKLTANAEPEALEPSIDPLSARPNDGPMLSHSRDEVTPQVQAEGVDSPVSPPEEPQFNLDQTPDNNAAEESQPHDEPQQETELQPEITTSNNEEVPTLPVFDQIQDNQTDKDQTLSDLEAAVESPHVSEDTQSQTQEQSDQASDAEAALAAAHQAFDSLGAQLPEKPAAFNASGPMEVPHDEPELSLTDQPFVSTEPMTPPASAAVQIDPATGMLSYPNNLVPPNNTLPSDPTATNVEDPTAPPPVPPPMPMPPISSPSGTQIDPNNLPPVQ